jgi:hypothetical protein
LISKAISIFLDLSIPSLEHLGVTIRGFRRSCVVRHTLAMCLNEPDSAPLLHFAENMVGPSSRRRYRSYARTFIKSWKNDEPYVAHTYGSRVNISQILRWTHHLRLMIFGWS